MIKIRIRANMSFTAFLLSLIVFFLQQFYESLAVTVVIHALDIGILLLILTETFLPIAEEKYLKKYL